MIDFDTRLRQRLQQLDAAIPEPAPPVLAIPPRRANRRRQVLFLLAAAALLLAATALATVAQPDPESVARNAADEERVRDDLGPRTENACLSRDQAARLIRQRLDALGLTNWKIRADDRTKEARCVTGAPIGDRQEVLLLASMGGDVARALDDVATSLMAQCLSRDKAMALVRNTLADLGLSSPRVEATGIRQVPVEGGDAYVRHVNDGCYVYGGAQFDDVGRYTWFVSGP
jgi:hypothetical protein